MTKITRNLIIKSSYEMGKDNIESSNNVILPPDLLEEILASKYENYFFKIKNSELGIYTYVGVMEFSAEENTIIVPFWLYEYLAVNDSSVVELELVDNIIKGQKIILEPLDEEFFKIPEYEAVLEGVLSKYSVLQYNSVIKINALDKTYAIKINDIEHDYSGLLEDEENINQEKLCDVNQEAIDIINTDLNVEIINTYLQKELERQKKEEEERQAQIQREMAKEMEERIKKKNEEKKQNLTGKTSKFIPFSGKGHRLGGD